MKPVGILGGGQLAQMLALEAHRLSLPVAILSPKEDDPARAVSGFWQKGDPNDLASLTKFMKTCSSVTFESEFYNAEIIAQASKATGVPVWPRPETMGLLQDRLSQKKLFDEYDLPTSPWRPVDSGQDAVVAFSALHQSVVYKKRRGGYDGYGTFVVRDTEALSKFARDQLTVGPRGEKTGSFIAEKWIRFKRELAIIAARDQKGRVFFFPFVESKQLNSRCLWVKGPLKETAAMREMKKLLAKFLNGIDYVGAMGIEFFDTKDGLILNEIAPRVHNTGHYTMDAFGLSQFALHLRAVAGFPIAEPKMLSMLAPRAKGFAMWNLLGTGDHRPAPWNAKTSEFLHWYGKAESREGRKMGHVNALGKSADTALAQAKKHAANLNREIGY